MSILIKGMEMPKSCYKCPLRRRDGMDIVCPVAHERFSVADVNILEYRLDNCPLVPVPQHGKLIDSSTIWNLLYDYADSIGVSNIVRFDKIMEAAFSNAPTIIPETK